MKNITLIASVLFIGILFSTPFLDAHAATVDIVSPTQTVGANQPLFMTVRLHTDDSSINVVEGSITIPEGITVDSIDTAGSTFSLWAQKPEYVIADRSVVFAGGVSKGIAPSSTAVLFTIHAHSTEKGTYRFSPGVLSSYRNDGKGTKEDVTVTSVSITVDDSPSSQTAPAYALRTPITVDVGQDDSLFEGAYFAAFYGGDQGQGIKHYFIQEGIFGERVLADHFYVLQDQSLSTSFLITAVGSDGSSSSKIVFATNPWKEIIMLMIFGILASIVFCVFRKMRTEHNAP